jgi:hypothetical protein
VDVRFVGRGHDRIRATHAKTLELSMDPDITERATCVIAVGVEGPATPMAGPVRIEISAGGETFELHALANSSWDPSGPAVIRRSPLRLPGTLATHADAASADLPRALVAALQSASAIVEVTIEPEPTAHDTVVLFAADLSRAADPRLTAEIDAAHTIVAEDDAARRLVAPRPGGPGATGRTLVVATRDLPGGSVHAHLVGATVETVGLPAALAAAAASPSRGPLTLAPSGADPRELMRSTPAGHRLVLATGADRLLALLSLALDVRGTAGATLAQDYAPPLRVVDGAIPELPSQDTVHVCLDAATESSALDPAVRAALKQLLADGVPTKTVAKVLTDLTGRPRREAYDAILHMGAERA